MPKVYYKNILEIACFSVEACLEAEKAGADRIEFCAEYGIGGITPKHEDVLRVKKLISIPVHVIIRPRGGNFLYSSEEIEIMKNDILFCKSIGINGVVFGVLNAFNKIDLEINKELIEFAKPMSTTFHRAIDECENLEEAISDVIKLGFDRVLTSGGKKNALDGVEELRTLNRKFGTTIIVIAGGGIRSSNFKSMINETQCKEYHSAAITNNTDLIDANEVTLLKEIINQI